jgi:Ca-activated chloride channel family protein
MASRRIFHGEEGTFKDIILITDGDDQDSFPVQAAQEAVRQGIRIFTVGLGDPDGTRLRGIEYRGQPVVSRLDESLLREIAFTHPDGRYLPVRTGTADLGELYRAAIATAEKREQESRETKVFEEWFQIPLAVAILALVAEGFLAERRRRPRPEEAATGAGGTA